MKAFEPLLVLSILANQYPMYLYLKKGSFRSGFHHQNGNHCDWQQLDGISFWVKKWHIARGLFTTTYKYLFGFCCAYWFFTRKCWKDSVIILWFAPSSNTKGPSNRRGRALFWQQCATIFKILDRIAVSSYRFVVYVVILELNAQCNTNFTHLGHIRNLKACTFIGQIIVPISEIGKQTAMFGFILYTTKVHY